MATLNDVISCYNELVDEVNGHTASIETLTAKLADVPTSTAMASLTAKLSQLEARLDELVQEHDVMMDTISSLLAAPAQTEETEGTVELKRVGKKGEEEQPAQTVSEEEAPAQTVEEEQPAQTVEEEQPAPALKRVGKKAAQTVVEEAPAPTVEEKTEAPAPAPAPTEAVAALKRASAPKTKTVAPKTTTTEIQKRAFARQYMVEHGAKVEDLRNPERINETIASEEFTAWMNAR